MTGRVLVVDGPVQLEMGLPPRVVLNDVRLSNAQWGTRADMARIRRVEIDLNPASVISGGNSVAQVRIDGADVMLETNLEGATNWQLAQVLPAGGAGAGVSALNALGLIGAPSSVVISNTVVTFHNGVTGDTQIIPINPPVEVVNPGGGGAC